MEAIVTKEQLEMMKNDDLVITDYEMIGLKNTEKSLKEFSDLFNLGELKTEIFGEEKQHMIVQCEHMINPITRINLRQKGYPIYWGNDFIDNNTIKIKK